jgi:OPT family oligopeptide transporter
MSLFQTPPQSEAEAAQDRPLDLPPEKVQELTEAEWYAQAYRGNSTQLTVRAVVMGSILGFFLSFTNIYLGLKSGWFLGVAITACILSYAIWGVLLRAGAVRSPMTILETACMASTASSAGYATGNTLVSAIPAMLLLTVTEQNPEGVQLRWYVLAPWVLFLAGLGVVMAIPMKRNMINQERLKFPSGTAAAVTLQSLYSQGQEAMVKARALLWSALVGLAVPLLKDLEFLKKMGADGKLERHALLPGQSNLFDVGVTFTSKLYDPKAQQWVEKALKPSDWLVRLDHSLVLVAAGAIVGLRTSASMVLGAGLLAFVIGPMALGWGWEAPSGKMLTAATRAGSAWKEIGIWCGAPLMVAYGLTAFAIQWRTILRALTGMRGGAAEAEGASEAAEIEVPTRWFVSGMSLAALGIVLIAWLAFGIPVHLGLLAVLMTFFLALVACRATGETDITPGGAMGKIMQLTYGVLMPQSTAANLMTAAITSGAGLASADLLNDLKTGYLLGANPRRQFVAQFLGIFTGTVASLLGYFLLVPNAKVLLGEGDKAPVFPAPGAQQWKAVAELFKVGLSNLHPMARYALVIGAVLGVTMALIEWLAPKSKKFLPSATGLGLGLLLPFFSSLSMLIGALLARAFEAMSPRQAERFVIPVSSGLIAGESIIGVIVAGLNNFVF